MLGKNDFKEGEYVVYIGMTPKKEIYAVEVGKIKLSHRRYSSKNKL